ncbi:MAG: hypothetical protein GY877_05420 [Hyphomicrobium sp.]|nr:hypothetical protein [Hyphomicrobium sp.]
MKEYTASPLLALAAAIILLGGSVAPSFSGAASKDEAEVILEDAKKNDPVTAADLEACMKDWDPETRMTKKEWEVSCKRTLKYFPEDE